MARRGRIGAPASRTEGRPRQIPWRMRIDKGAAYNGAGGVDLALEHAPLPSSRERTTRSSAHTRGGGGVSEKTPVHRQRVDDRCTCPNGTGTNDTVFRSPFRSRFRGGCRNQIGVNDFLSFLIPPHFF
jgi:hypothetical protein